MHFDDEIDDEVHPEELRRLWANREVPHPLADRKRKERARRGGPYTGRCARCGSSDLWDDNLSYGCRKCGLVHVGNM